MPDKQPETYYPKTRLQWRKWLQKHHQTQTSVWLISYKKASAHPGVKWEDSVEEALCFGWIDSKRVSIDEEKYMQFFCKRKPKSNWSKINKEKVERLIAEGLMTPAGLDSIEIAKQNGSWNISDQVEADIIPKDLLAAFKANPGSKAFFLSLSKSVRKILLQWVFNAKRPETREKRIIEIATHAAKKMKPKNF